MTDKEPFEDRLASWSLAQLKVEDTKSIYGPRKKARISTRIAEIENGLVEDPGAPQEDLAPPETIAAEDVAEKPGINWTMWGTIILLVSAIVGAAGVYYAGS